MRDQNMIAVRFGATKFGVGFSVALALAGCAGNGFIAEQQINPANTEAAINSTASATTNDAPAAGDLAARVDVSPSRLVLAARYGEIDTVKYLIDAGVAVDARDAHGNTALIAAAANAQRETVGLLLDRGANINAVNIEDSSALMGAAAKADYKLVHQLLQAGAEVNARNNKGETALFLAVQYGDYATTQVLLNGGANPNIKNTLAPNLRVGGFTPLMYAVTNGLTQQTTDWQAIARLLLESGADPNLTDSHGNAALNLAVQRKDEAMVTLLRQGGAYDDRAYATLSNDDALLRAARTGDERKVAEMAANGANINYINPNGITPLLAAAYEGQLAMVKKLIAQGAQVNFVPSGLAQFAMAKSHAPLSERGLMEAAARGDTALLAAGRQGQFDIVTYLLTQGAQANLPNRRGDTLLYIAASDGNADLMKVLLDHGADPNTLERDSRTNRSAAGGIALGRNSVLIRAAQGGHEEAVKLLLTAGADINYRGVMGKTALYNAIENDRPAVAELLLNRDADANIANMAGTMPLMEAARRGNRELAQLLLTKGANINAVEKPDLGYSVPETTLSGMTALLYAAHAGQTETVKLLVGAGAEINVHNSNGKTAIREAADRGNAEVVQLLRTAGSREEVTLLKLQGQ